MAQFGSVHTDWDARARRRAGPPASAGDPLLARQGWAQGWVRARTLPDSSPEIGGMDLETFKKKRCVALATFKKKTISEMVRRERRRTLLPLQLVRPPPPVALAWRGRAGVVLPRPRPRRRGRCHSKRACAHAHAHEARGRGAGIGGAGLLDDRAVALRLGSLQYKRVLEYLSRYGIR